MTEILDLATIVERDTINLRSKKYPAGKQYELLGVEELGPYELAMLNSRYETMKRLSAVASRKATVKEERELRKALGDILKLIVIDLEPQVLNEIENTQRARIITAWSTATTAGVAEGEARESLSTTASSSRGSKRSTAAARTSGSTSRRTR